jgi:diguanylate cyclase (GGDEF)-like protein/PAS domain S-box-containing protein
MKRKILFYLLALFFFTVLSAGFATLYIINTTDTLSRLITLHQIEGLRKDLIMSVQAVQSDLYTVNTSLGRRLDEIADNVDRLDKASSTCTTCHHSPEITAQISAIRSMVLDYEGHLSYFITASANRRQILKMQMDAAATGNQLLVETEKMSIQASSRLEGMTTDVMNKVKRTGMIIFGMMIATMVFGTAIALQLTVAITRPIGILVEATRRIAAGELGYQVVVADKTEFGELSSNFNTMSTALKDGYAKLEAEIAERKQAEAALKGSESFLNNIFHSIHDPFCIIDRDYRIVRANEAYAQLKQTELPGLVDRTCYEVLYGRTSQCDNCIVQKTFLSGEASSKDKLVIAPDGRRIWLEIYAYPIVSPDGQLSHVVEYTHDITERKNTEEALRESEERYALAARGANDGLWDWDLRANTIYFSPRWKAMLGFDDREISTSPEEWLGRVHPDDRAALEAMIATHLIGDNQPFEGEFRIRRKDDTYSWVLNRGMAVRSKTGQAYRMAGSQTDITARKRAEAQLLYDAFHDALTGLPNRALFMDRLQHIIDSARRRTGALYAVLFLDMDRFKVINDSLGHLVGDQLLIAVGKKVSGCLRPGDTVARLGGDEFAILLENISDVNDAVDIAERIRTELAHPFIIAGNCVFTGFSIGIAPSAADYERPEQVLRDADIAMYQAKARGGSCYEIYDARMHAGVIARLQLEADLRRAVDRQEFVLHYQPIMDLQASRLIGFEALIRWVHPRHGMIYPMEFIPLAEETGLIGPIGEWVLSEACRRLVVWHRQYPQDPPLKMSMNISGKQFSRSDLAEVVTRILQETGLPPDSLALEITESMIMVDLESAIKTMGRLRAMGIQIHIDDFGTGYSSLSHLHRFPITALKIDRAFVQKLLEGGENDAIITSIVTLAKSLNLEVIAEGIELDYQLSSIKGLRCQYGQGFLFSRAMPPAAVDIWIESGTPMKG